MGPSVSIILATYNGAKFLSQQLESIVRQTRLPDELIVNDDRSTDDTVAILRRFAGTAPFPVRVGVNGRQLGYRANFHKAVRLATSDLVMFCDQDDIWHPDKVEVMARAFADDRTLMLAYHHASVVDADARPVGPVSDPAAERAALARDLPPPWHFARGLLQAFRRDLTRFDDLLPLSREHFSGEVLAHDWWYFSLALALGRVGYVERDLLMYRQHGANLYGADRRRGLWGGIADRLKHHADSDLYGAAAARSRALVFEAMRPRVTPDQQHRLDRCARAYRSYADRLERRRATYTARSLSRRMLALGRSLAHGDYRGNPWGFDPRSIVRDAWTGVAAMGRGTSRSRSAWLPQLLSRRHADRAMLRARATADR